MSDPVQVRAMFARIARRYDFLNHALSLGVDRLWRRRLVTLARVRPGDLAVDLCSGTGDLALALHRAGARVVGADFTHEMLERALRKRAAHGLAFVQADALRLPFAGGVAQLAGVAFGIRNVHDPERALREMLRVLRPGGRALVLEFSTPRGRLLGGLYRLYFTRILPRLGGWIAGDREAYEYLPRTVQSWPAPERFQGLMELAGFMDCGWEPLTGGIACLHWGTRG